MSSHETAPAHEGKGKRAATPHRQARATAGTRHQQGEPGVGTLGLALEGGEPVVGTLGLTLEDGDTGVGTLGLPLEGDAPGVGTLGLSLEGSGAPAGGPEGSAAEAAEPPTRARSHGSQVHVQRQGQGQGTIEPLVAGSVLDRVSGASAGQAMAPAVQHSMESSFGRSFGDVRVHTDDASARAAQDLHANAFTVDRDIYFNRGAYAPDTDQGKHLLAHELAHVAQGNAVAASARGAGPTVSSPGDAAELAADRAADSVMRGQAVGELGSAPASVLHRDSVADVRSLSEGNWLGDVDEGEILRRVAAMSPADKARLAADSATLGRICGAFDASEMLQLFVHLPCTLRKQLDLLSRAGEVGDMSDRQWRWLLANASPSEMEAMRGDAAAYRLFLQHAPADLVPPWDLLQGLENGTWRGNATAVRNAVNQLNADQRTTVRDDAGKMLVIMRHCGQASEAFRTLQYLDMPVKWQVYWLHRAGMIGSIVHAEWAQMLAEGSKQELDELVGWSAMYQLVSQHCPADVLLIVHQQTGQNARREQEQADAAAATAAGPAPAGAPATGGTAPAPATPATPSSFDDRVQLDALFTSLGPAAFLALATQNAGDVDDNYAKIDAAGKVMPTIEGLQRGARMGVRTAANLKQWFLSGNASDAAAQRMFEQRFAVTLGGAGSYDHTRDRDRDGNPDATLAPWTKPGLQLMWQVCEALPAQAVEQNPRLLHILRDRQRGPGSAYYAGPRQGADGDVLMGYRRTAELGQTTADPTSGMYGHETIYHAGAGGPGSPAVQMPRFNATLRHEIGHAVDAQMGIMERWRRQEPVGAWEQYGSWSEFVDAIITAGGGMSGHGYPGGKEAVYKRAMLRACEQNQTFSAALTALGETPLAADPGGPVSAVWEPIRYRPANNSGPWYRNTWAPIGGRNFQSAYGSETSLYSFRAAARNAHMVTSYQWRAPGEWFAEVYQVYYAEQESDPAAPVGGLLRSKDSYAADMMSNVVDRGHSPQGMAGGGTVNAPGTGGSP